MSNNFCFCVTLSCDGENEYITFPVLWHHWISFFYVSSITDSKIYVSKIRVKPDGESSYVYTETNDEIFLEKSETEYAAMYKLTYKDTYLGTITIPYATASNIPEFEGNNVHEYTIIE